MPVKIQNAEEIKDCVKLLIYGPSGVGKTVFGATAPKVLFLDAEGGMLSVKDKKIDRIKIDVFGDMGEAFMFLKNDKHEYETVVIDSLTELQKKSMDAILKETGKAQPTIGNWGTNIEQIRRMVRNFRDLPMNVIITALESVEKDEEEGTSCKHPALQGKTLPQEVMGFMDVVGYMVASEKVVEPATEKKAAVIDIVRGIRVQPTKKIAAKDRSGKLGIWTEPSFKHIHNDIFGKPEPKAKAKAKAKGKK